MLSIGTRVFSISYGEMATVIEPTNETIFCQYGYARPQPMKYETNKAYMRRVAELHERSIVRGIPSEFEGEPVDPADFVAVKLDDGAEWYWQMSEVEIVK